MPVRRCHEPRVPILIAVLHIRRPMVIKVLASPLNTIVIPPLLCRNKLRRRRLPTLPISRRRWRWSLLKVLCRSNAGEQRKREKRSHPACRSHGGGPFNSMRQKNNQPLVLETHHLHASCRRTRTTRLQNLGCHRATSADSPASSAPQETVASGPATAPSQTPLGSPPAVAKWCSPSGSPAAA